MATAVVYGSSTGNTEGAAQAIAEKIGAEVLDIADTSAEDLNGYDKLILGSSTWGEGEYQDDWEDFDWGDVNLEGKTVALFGIGDQESYADTFCDAVGMLYETVTEKGATVVGEWDNDGYEFEESRALKDDKFVGLILDSDNQDDLTEERIDKWVESIKSHF